MPQLADGQPTSSQLQRLEAFHQVWGYIHAKIKVLSEVLLFSRFTPLLHSVLTSHQVSMHICVTAVLSIRADESELTDADSGNVYDLLWVLEFGHCKIFYKLRLTCKSFCRAPCARIWLWISLKLGCEFLPLVSLSALTHQLVSHLGCDLRSTCRQALKDMYFAECLASIHKPDILRDCAICSKQPCTIICKHSAQSHTHGPHHCRIYQCSWQCRYLLQSGRRIAGKGKVLSKISFIMIRIFIFPMRCCMNIFDSTYLRACSSFVPPQTWCVGDDLLQSTVLIILGLLRSQIWKRVCSKAMSFCLAWYIGRNWLCCWLIEYSRRHPNTETLLNALFVRFRYLTSIKLILKSISSISKMIDHWKGDDLWIH